MKYATRRRKSEKRERDAVISTEKVSRLKDVCTVTISLVRGGEEGGFMKRGEKGREETAWDLRMMKKRELADTTAGDLSQRFCCRRKRGWAKKGGGGKKEGKALRLLDREKKGPRPGLQNRIKRGGEKNKKKKKNNPTTGGEKQEETSNQSFEWKTKRYPIRFPKKGKMKKEESLKQRREKRERNERRLCVGKGRRSTLISPMWKRGDRVYHITDPPGGGKWKEMRIFRQWKGEDGRGGRRSMCFSGRESALTLSCILLVRRGGRILGNLYDCFCGQGAGKGGIS